MRATERDLFQVTDGVLDATQIAARVCGPLHGAVATFVGIVRDHHAGRRVLWLEYEDTRPGSSAPVKYKRTFHDYRTIQGTRMPYRTVLYADGKQVEESQILTVVYGVKMEDTVFQNPEAASTP